MAKAKKTTTPLNHDGDQDQAVASDTDWPATPTTDATIPPEAPDGSTQPTTGSIVTKNGKLDITHPKYAGIPYFRDTRANVNNIDPNDICWDREFGDRHILCWANPKKGSHKDVQLIVVGRIKTADLEKPNRYGTYNIDLQIDEKGRQVFDSIWKTGKWGDTPGFSTPISNQGVARFNAKLEAINKEAKKKKLDLVLTEHDPFPGLYNGSGMHKNNTVLIPHPAPEFTEGATVAVEAAVATYNLTNEDGIRRFGYSLGIREVYWICEHRPEDGDEDSRNDNIATPSKRRLSEDDLVSPRSFKRKNRVATFDPLSDDD
jgi:hypothetical protein